MPFSITLCASDIVGACFGNVTDSFVFLVMYFPYAFINVVLYGVKTEAFKCVRYQSGDQLMQGCGTAPFFLLILWKPLGFLIRNNSALMFSPLAREVYLWAVWEDTHAYLHTHALTKCAFPLVFPPQNIHAHREEVTLSHRHKRGAEILEHS